MVVLVHSSSWKVYPRPSTSFIQGGLVCFRRELYSVSVPSHAALVLLNEGLAVGGRVIGFGEEHALVALGLFFLAHTTRLEGSDIIRRKMLSVIDWIGECAYLGFGGCVRLGSGRSRNGFCRKGKDEVSQAH